MIKAISSSRVLYQGKLSALAIIIDAGIIRDIVSINDIPTDCQHHNYGNSVIMPGLVDTHVHINEPGRTDWEGFNTATQAAAAGGITTVIDMPLNCIPVTTTLDAVNVKKACLHNQMWVDVGFHGGVIPDNENELSDMINVGITTFKAFMIDSGVDEFPASDSATLDKAMPILAQGNATLLVHAELDSCGKETQVENESSYAEFLASRPDNWEINAITEIIRLSKKHNCKVHIVHLSSAQALDIIHKAQKDGVRISAETCPHYLTLSSDSIPDGDGRFKCCPPIRNNENQDALWQGLQDDIIGFIVSDHSPCTPALKRLQDHNLWQAWGGISSLQFGLSLIWTALQKRGHSIADLAKWMCERPAGLVNLSAQKGQISQGFDADFVIWNPEDRHTIEQKNILHKNKLSAYEQQTVSGVVQQTILAGDVIFDKDKTNFNDSPKGKALFNSIKNI
jgi:allantoinase